MPIAQHLGELRTHLIDRIRERDQAESHVTVAAPSRRRWRQMTALGLWRCPDCRAVLASGKSAAKDMAVHDQWHDKLDELLNHILDTIQGAAQESAGRVSGYPVEPGMIPATAAEWPSDESREG